MPKVPSGDEAMIRLSIVRHGKAEPDSDTGLDHDRPLRDKGERQVRYLTTYFGTHSDHVPGLILHSGLVRARKTAEPIASALGVELRQADGLCPEDPPSAALDLVTRIARGKPVQRSIMIVGHNPQLGSLIGILTSGICGEDALLRTGEGFILDINLNQPIGSARLVDRVRMPGEHQEVVDTGRKVRRDSTGKTLGAGFGVR